MELTIEDILLDLKDEGFDCVCNAHWNSVEIRIYYHGVERHSEKYAFIYDDIKDQMERIYYYLSEKSNDILFYFIEKEEREHCYPLYNVDILSEKFPLYYDEHWDGFMVYFELPGSPIYSEYKKGNI